jgi:hypothetical protein
LLLVVHALAGLIIAIATPGLLLLAVPALLLGLWFLRGARAVVRFAYPDAEAAEGGSDAGR